MNETVIVIPCYNEAERLIPETFLKFLENNKSIFLKFVNDGSTDDTASVLGDLSNLSPNISVLDLTQNSGKAEACRQGILEALKSEPQFVGYWDADLATPLDEITVFIEKLENNTYEMVSGLRLARMGANIKRKLRRHYLGRCFATIVSTLLKVEVYDTQCGAKIFKRELAEKVFQHPFISRWLFDVEIFKKIIAIYGTEKSNEIICEYPLSTWIDVGGTKLSLMDFIKAPFELFKIFIRRDEG